RKPARHTRCGITIFVGALLIQLASPLAAPLDKASCDKLKTEQGALEQEGIRAAVAKGPDWAKANLSAEKLTQLRRLLEVDGQLLFRCNGRPLVELPKDADGEVGGETEERAPPTQAAKPPAPKKKALARNKPAPPAKKAQAKEATAAKKGKPASGQGAGGEVAKPEPKAKPKPKIDDAYRPPAPDPTSQPLR